MIDRLLAFLSGLETPHPSERTDDTQFAVAALLIEAGRMDNNFDAAERATIERLLAGKFNLAPQAVRSLVEAAEQRVRQSAQYYPFTREICSRLSREERVEILEMLWKVAYADGVLDPYEDTLLRQIAGLIHVPDRDRGLARQRALESLQMGDSRS
ncbi:TerB family tellurite resistance protein [Hyphomicrobium sp.]|uniref:tellurite resistance TerB family protein n=1 Tax=Hyphomicrobium sp. TaxID=82 RepID=UPI002E345B82|nr:TerB family tellurite resistance protein [Hyphomicrobium sp.]HEX2840190.1 TerB family tellurite resistance protein [Hyphomicrobium sp.]